VSLSIQREEDRLIWLLAYIATIFGANWAISTFGFIPVGFGLLAPAGVLFAGAALAFRDLLQDALGRWWVFAAILAGAALSYIVSPQFALASGAAFLLSEAADLLVYTPLRKRNWYAAVAASNVVGLVVDSALFLLIAFGSLNFIAGQIVGKTEVTALFLLAAWAWRSRAVPQRSGS
jgi:uncharacterized PurR-regulated membrane protein YhhQ (DUF165 family)